MLSYQAQSLWAKTDPAQPLFEHLRRTAEVARTIWRGWLPFGTRDVLARDLGQDGAERLAIALAALHDIGKATPAFQLRPHIPADLLDAVRNAGLSGRSLSDAERARARHELASQVILERHGVQRTVAVVAGGHHGRPPSIEQMEEPLLNSGAFGFGVDAWRAVQDELFDYALGLADMRHSELCGIRLTIPQQMLLTGLVSLADWIASSGEVSLPERWAVRDEWERFGGGVFLERFDFEANAMQSVAVDAALGTSSPGIAIIEAAMGTGKTEAALALAEIFAQKTGRSGVYFALPTRATADGIFGRYVNWIRAVSGGEPHALTLAHSKAKFNEQYRALRHIDVTGEADGMGGGVFVHDWLAGRKTQLLADFAVGTIDQLLMGALRHKYIALRHLGFANKVVIIDEVHAYDAYMDSYLYRALRWLGAYGVPVVVLSATLPSDTRRKLVAAYLGRAAGADDRTKGNAYPLLTYTDGDAVKQACPPAHDGGKQTVAMERFDGDIGEKLDVLLRNGGCAGVVVNTVTRAQAIARQLAERFGADTVFLLHSRYTARDRAAREAQLLGMLGPPRNASRPQRLIVVGTQVVEQSLDIDFDVMLTDCCPMDLLLQRIGRLHRHNRPRPGGLELPRCLVMQADAPDGGSLAVYGAYALLCTHYLLPDAVSLPDDITRLVQAAYGGEISVPEGECSAFEAARREQDARIDEKERRAQTFQLADPMRGKSDLVGWLDYPNRNATDRQGEASVRDGEGALEVILLQRGGDGYRLLPWANDGQAISHDRAPDTEVSYVLAGCCVALPRVFTAHYKNLDVTINELESLRQREIPSVWDESHWLRGALYLPLDENLTAHLRGKKLRYDPEWGLTVGADGGG